MSTYHTRALLLRKTPLRESDLIFKMLLEDGSCCDAVARGILKPRAKMGGTLQVFSTVDLLLATGRNLETVCEAHLIEANPELGNDLVHLSGGSCICELLCKLALPGQEQAHLFEMSRTALASLGRVGEERVALVSAAALLKIASLLGYRPQLEECVYCGESVRIAKQGPQPFTWRDGGTICMECAPMGVSSTEDGTLLAWIHRLIYSTFAEVEAFPDEVDAVGRDMLRFAQRWLSDHVDVRLKSIDYLFL